MSKIGKQSITLPEAVRAEIFSDKVKISGPKGELVVAIPSSLKVVLEEKTLSVSRLAETRQTKANHGTIRSLLANAVAGVSSGWTKELEIVGTGYRAEIIGKDLSVKIGFSHPVIIKPPAGITFEVKDEKIIVLGIDKELVGNIAAKIRLFKKIDPYKGKGIRYTGEEIKLKQGKTAKIGVGG